MSADPQPHTAILSVVVPPQASGQAVILGRLVSENPELLLITNQKQVPENATHKVLSCATPFSKYIRYGSVTTATYRLFCAIEIRLRAKRLQRILKEHNIGRLVVCSGELLNLPVAARIARKTQLEIVPYFFDDYVNQWKPKFRRLALDYENAVFAQTEKCIVPNEYAADVYAKRHVIRPKVVRNLAAAQAPARNPKAFDPNDIRIGFYGSVYHANTDAFAALLKALDLLQETRPVKLSLFTSQKKEEVAALFPEHMHLLEHSDHLSQEEIRESLGTIDLLYLPLGFHTGIGEVIRTSAPGKLAEYLAMGKPILAHVPQDCWVAWYFGYRHLPGLAATDDPSKLAKRIAETIEELEQGNPVTEYDKAAADFDPEQVRRGFYEYLGV
jgi:hypothetical protein